MRVLGALIVAATVAFGGQIQAQDREQPEYTLGSGDQIRVQVFGQDDISGEFELDGSGTISMSLIGQVEIGGLTVRKAESKIVDKLKPDYLKNPRVSIQVMNYRPFYILGEVKEPGSYPYVNGMTVMEAIALAGGYTYRADKDDVEIIRAEKAGREAREASENAVVMPGDTVRVPERFF